jgi:CRP-like cAMP-binding protein
MFFGESFMLGSTDKNRFFNAVALTDCSLLQLSKEGYDYMVSTAERKIFTDKKMFLLSIPEFRSLSLPRSKLVHLCENMHPMSCIKN